MDNNMGIEMDMKRLSDIDTDTKTDKRRDMKKDMDI
jgi:hypothetical protein